MAMNGLQNLANLLENLDSPAISAANEVFVDAEIGKKAVTSITRMLDFAAAKKAKVQPGPDLAKEAQLFSGIGPA
jgi:quinolinate synthase